LDDEISYSGKSVRTTRKITRGDFLKFVGTIGIGIVAAPIFGSIGRVIPSYYSAYYTTGNSQNQAQSKNNNNNNNDDSFVREAEAATLPNDKNGVRYLQPLSSFRLKYSNETWSFDRNFRSDGSMRCDFNGVRNSVCLAGYFKVGGSDDGEEVSAKMNGGPHNDRNPEYADTMDLGIVNFAGTKSRVRWEKTHPNYSSSIGPTYSQLPIGDIRNKWRGFCGFKVNLDDDGDGKPDRVAIVGMVDVGGLDSTTMKPINNWKTTYRRIFTPSQIGLKSIWTPYVATIGKPELAQNTIRIDQQSQSKWQSSNPPYKYVSCKKVTATKI
jgi:hypothetical protein